MNKQPTWAGMKNGKPFGTSLSQNSNLNDHLAKQHILKNLLCDCGAPKKTLNITSCSVQNMVQKKKHTNKNNQSN